MMIIGQCFTLIGISVIIATFDWKIVVIFIIFVTLSAKIEAIAKKKAMRLSQEIVSDQRGWMYYAGLFEDVSYGKEIRMNSMGKWLLSRERNYFIRVNTNLKQQNDYYIKAGNWGAFFTFIQQAIAYGFLLTCIIREMISIGSFTMYIGAVTTFAASLKSAIASLTEIRAYDMYYDDLDEYLSTPMKLREGKQQEVIHGNYTLEFKNVCFRYPGSEKYALKNINLTIKNGEKLAIVGENGAGKTTFVKLLIRVYDPMEIGGLYKELFDMQAQFYCDEPKKGV